MRESKTSTKPKPIGRLNQTSQSIWLDFIRRAFILSGDLERYIQNGWISGLTSNPSIFAKAITGSTDYDLALDQLAREGVTDPYEVFVSLAVEDIRRAADLFRDVYEKTGMRDGYVSLETPPGIENDSARTVEEARRLFALVDRPNVMIKVPATSAGITALEQLIADGINVNVTLIFAIETYREVANAYIRGLSRRKEAEHAIDHVASVASFFISRIDTAVDSELPEGHYLRSRIAVANARHAYQTFTEIFVGAPWSELAQAGAMVQRPLWASTSVKNPALSETHYVDELASPNTVNTMPEPTLRSFAEVGDGRSRLGELEITKAASDLAALSAQGVNVDSITTDLLDAGLNAFQKDFTTLLEAIQRSLDSAHEETLRGLGVLQADEGLSAQVDDAIGQAQTQDLVRRIWRKDHSIWSDNEREITDRLGWLTVAESLAAQVDDLSSFATAVWAHGITDVVLLGMGGSSLAPEVLADSFREEDSPARLHVLDTTDPAAIRAVESQVDHKKTLFVAASKSGSTIETLTQLDYFWSKFPDGSHFIAITDPGSGLADIGKDRRFRRVFLNQPDIGGRYSALSHFGMVPAALVGIDIAALLEHATTMQCAIDGCVPVGHNPGVLLAAVLGAAATNGRDKVTVIAPPEIKTFGTWIEQLLAESTGKEGKGLVPVEGEDPGPPDVYGDDRLFVVIGNHPGVEAIRAAGHPVFSIPFDDRDKIGAEFLRWEMATAIAGHILGIHPFDQPNVQEAKDITSKILSGATFSPETPAVSEVLSTVSPGDYVAILAYIPRNAENINRLQAVRLKLRERYRVATTVGFGPRFLHSTGQLHKGGPNSGVFLQIVGDDRNDIDISGREFTFGELKTAQALGDLESLRSKGRRVARVSIEDLEGMLR